MGSSASVNVTSASRRTSSSSTGISQKSSKKYVALSDRNADKKEKRVVSSASRRPSRRERASPCPVRRIQYIFVPVGETRSLAKPVFDVQTTDAIPCTDVEIIHVSVPELTHVTTDTLVVQWKVDSWSERKRVAKYDVQIKQLSLKKNQYLQMWGMDMTQQNEEDGQEVERPLVEFFCDGEFSSIPSRVIHHFDTRSELIISGLSGDCDPLVIRVRALAEKSKWEETKKGGWGPFSKTSKELRTLSTINSLLNPFAERAYAHALQLQWSCPLDDSYGKISSFRLLGRLSVEGRKEKKKTKSVEERNSLLLAVRPLKSASRDDTAYAESPMAGGPRTPKSPSVSKKTGWQDHGRDEIDMDTGYICLFEGPGTSFTIGEPPLGSMLNRTETERVAAHRLLRAATIERTKFWSSEDDASAAYERYLDHDAKYEFKVEAVTGTWFRGNFRESVLSSEATCIATTTAVPDPPNHPFVMQYHGLVTSKTVHLTWRAPSTYGGGYDVHTYNELVLKSSRGIIAGKFDTGLTRKSRIERLSDEGWKLQKDHTWMHQDTGEQRYDEPACASFERIKYQLHARKVDGDARKRHPFYIAYAGGTCSFTAQADPNTEYEFCVSASNEMGTSMKGPNFRVRSADPTLGDRVNPGCVTSALVLPEGWAEGWDPETEYVYFHHKISGTIQWKHPSGEVLDDPDLIFRKKRYRLLHSLGQRLPLTKDYGGDTIRMCVTRKNVLEDSLKALGKLPWERLNRRTVVTFANEDGIDSGGLTTEWYMLLSRAFLQPDELLFDRLDSGVYVITPRGSSELTSRLRQSYQFLGRIMAKAVYDQKYLDLPLCTSIFRELLGQHPETSDLQQIDSAYFSSLQWMLENDITDVIFETFSVKVDDRTFELAPGGKDVEVTQENKGAYVAAVSRWRLVESVQEEIDCIKAGFNEIMPADLLGSFAVDEFAKLLNGSDDVSVRELRLRAKYSNGYKSDSRMVKLFWEMLDDMSNHWRSQVLAFATGCPKLPLDGVQIEVVKSDDPPDTLPTSHTCFNQIVLPVYDNRDQFHEKLMQALENATGFYMT